MQEGRAAVMVKMSGAGKTSLTPSLQLPANHQYPFRNLLLTESQKKLVCLFQLKLKQPMATHSYQRASETWCVSLH